MFMSTKVLTHFPHYILKMRALDILLCVTGHVVLSLHLIYSSRLVFNVQCVPFSLPQNVKAVQDWTYSGYWNI